MTVGGCTTTSMPSRAHGCLLGQLSGDALESLVEFLSPEQIREDYPEGVRVMADGGTYNTIAGQPTDDSEMALVLARLLARLGRYDVEEARAGYVWWLESGPFDCGFTISNGLRGMPQMDSQANGALMRISPLGIFGAIHDPKRVADWAMQDAALTHPNPVCQQANALYVLAIAKAVRTGIAGHELYNQIIAWAEDLNVEPGLRDVIKAAESAPPSEFVYQQGWVLIAFQNALWQLLHAPSFADGVVDTVMRGGDTDTNAAICGALLGAVYGREAVPAQWVECLMNCRPEQGRTGVMQPRPECFWPVDALQLAEALLAEGEMP